MSVTVNISLLGFASFEKSTFESFFKLASRRDTVYKIVEDTSLAKIFLINGDNAAAASWVVSGATGSQNALFVGKPDASGRWLSTAPKPIRLTTILGLLDVMPSASDTPTTFTQETLIVEKRPSDAARSFEMANPVPPSPTAPPTAPVLTARQASVKLGPGSRSGSARQTSSDFGASSFMGLAKPVEKNTAAQQFDEILIVDDSDVALKFMQNRIARYGFRARLARSGEEALTRLATESYKFIFMDVMMEGLDGYQTCRAIKQRKYSSGKAPIVVMLTSRGGSIDKIRGGLAGCDAYLTKPLNEAELLKVLSKYDEQVERGFQSTKVGGSGMSSVQSH